MAGPLSSTMLAAMRRTAVNHMSDLEGKAEIIREVEIGRDRTGAPKMDYVSVSEWECRMQVIEQRKPLIELGTEPSYAIQHHRIALSLEAEPDLREHMKIRYKSKVYHVIAIWDAQTESSALHADLTIVE